MKQFECYGLSTTKTDTIRILDSFVVSKSTIHLDTFIISKSIINFWYATDLYFPFQLEQGLGYTPILHDKHICMLVEILIEGDDPSASTKITIAADTVEQTKLSVSLFQIPTTYTVKYEKVSEVFNTKKEYKVTDTKLEVLESIPPPPPPPKVPKSSTPPIKKEKETKPVKG